MKRLLPRLLTTLLAFATSSMVMAQTAKLDAPRPLPQKEKVVVSLPSKLKQLSALLLAKRLGEFEKENLDVEYSIHKPSDGMVLLATGRVDVTVSQASASFFNAAAGGTEIKQVAPTGFLGPKNGFWVSKAWLKDRPWNPAMLKGQTIASPAGHGSLTAWAVQQELAKAGLTLNDITWRALPVSDVIVALENGAINVALLLDPLWMKVDQSKATLGFPWPSDVTGGYFFGPNLLGPRRAVGEAFTRALVRTVRTHLQGDYGANPRVVEALAAELGLSEDQIRASANSMIFPPNMPLRKDLADLAQKTYFSTPGVLTYEKALSDEKVTDRSFLRAAGAEGS